MYKLILSVTIVAFYMSSNILAANHSSSYTDINKGVVSFDVSMPIDATGYTLKGDHLKGGKIQFKDNGIYISTLLSANNTQNIPLFSFIYLYRIAEHIV